MSFLSKTTAALVQRLKEKLPDRPVSLVPADTFFTRKVELPAGLGWSDKVAFIELALEGNAPFPLEQLAWGFLADEGSSYVVVYATPRNRLKKLGIDLEEPHYQVFPGFISLFGDTFDRPTIRFLSQNGILSALEMTPGNPVPEAIHSRRIRADILTDDEILKAREALKASLGGKEIAFEPGVWLGEGIDFQNDQEPVFLHRHVSAETPEPLRRHRLRLGGNSLWAADLRDDAYASRERMVRRRSVTIWKSLQLAAICALLFLMVQVGLFALSGYNTLLESKVTELEPLATRVENKLTLAQRLTESTEEDLKPFLLMETVNPLRPEAVFFDEVRSRAFDQLEIEGQSSEGVTPVNAFADSIRQLPYVASVVNNSQTRNNQTSFELLITFSAQPPEPEGGFQIPEDPEEEDSDETSNEEEG